MVQHGYILRYPVSVQHGYMVRYPVLVHHGYMAGVALASSEAGPSSWARLTDIGNIVILGVKYRRYLE